MNELLGKIGGEDILTLALGAHNFTEVVEGVVGFEFEGGVCLLKEIYSMKATVMVYIIHTTLRLDYLSDCIKSRQSALYDVARKLGREKYASKDMYFADSPEEFDECLRKYGYTLQPLLDWS